MPLSGVVESARAMLASFGPLDWALSLLAVWSILRGFLHGAVRELFAVLASVLAVLAAYQQYAPIAHWLERWIPSLAERDALALILVGASVFLAVTITGRVFRAVVHLTGLGPLDRVAGAALGGLRAALAGTILVTALVATPATRVWVRSSRVAPYVAASARLLAQFAPEPFERIVEDRISAVGRPGDSLR